MRICIDAGHGGGDPGATNPYYKSYRPEKEIALEVALDLERELKLRGHTVKMTRSTDVFISLQKRCDISNAFKADAFISIHCNAAESSAASGLEVIHAASSSRGRRLSDCILREMSRTFRGLKNRGLKASKSPGYNRWIRVVQKTAAPAALVELGFLSNKEEGALLNQPANWRKYAVAIADGIEGWA